MSLWLSVYFRTTDLGQYFAASSLPNMAHFTTFWKFEVLGYESLVLTNLVLAVFLTSAAGERRTTLIVAG